MNTATTNTPATAAAVSPALAALAPQMLAELEQVLYDADMAEACGEPRYDNTSEAMKSIRALVKQAGGNPHKYRDESGEDDDAPVVAQPKAPELIPLFPVLKVRRRLP